MRAAIGLFAALAVFGGAASAESPGITRTAGLYTPIPTVATDTLLRRVEVVKVKCTCKGSSKSVTLETDPCPGGVTPSCECPKGGTGGQPAAICAKARN
jgi:hypothetical protein